MAVSDDNTRLSVTVSNELKALLESDAQKAGHSVSRQIAIILIDHYQMRYPQHLPPQKNQKTKRAVSPSKA